LFTRRGGFRLSAISMWLCVGARLEYAGLRSRLSSMKIKTSRRHFTHHADGPARSSSRFRLAVADADCDWLACVCRADADQECPVIAQQKFKMIVINGAPFALC
jgi:hypothetical protein